jgi:hypothetical protein
MQLLSSSKKHDPLDAGRQRQRLQGDTTCTCTIKATGQ